MKPRPPGPRQKARAAAPFAQWTNVKSAGERGRLIHMKRRVGIVILAAGSAGAWRAAWGQSAPTRVATINAAGPSRSAAAPTPPPRPLPTPRLDDLTEFLDRSNKLKDSDVEGRLALARWSRDRKMWSQAAEMADQVLYRDPLNSTAYAILKQVDDARPLPAEPEEETALTEEFEKRFSHEFKSRNSKHFLMCYVTTDDFAIQRGAVM